MAALVIAALAEAAASYGIEFFDELKLLWLGIRQQVLLFRSWPPNTLHTSYRYSHSEVPNVGGRDEEDCFEGLVKQCAATEGVTARYITISRT